MYIVVYDIYIYIYVNICVYIYIYVSPIYINILDIKIPFNHPTNGVNASRCAPGCSQHLPAACWDCPGNPSDH